MGQILFLWGGFLLGCSHAMEADHVLTVSTLLMKKQALKKTLLLGLRWAIGHSLTLILLAMFMLIIQSTFASIQFSLAGRLVGISMVCLGIRVLYLELKNKYRPHAYGEEDHSHHDAQTGSILFGLGLLHGTSGSAPILLLIPIALSKSMLSVMGYVCVFSFGMILTMGIYSIFLNRMTWTNKFSAHLIKLRCATACLTMAIGFKLIGE